MNAHVLERFTRCSLIRFSETEDVEELKTWKSPVYTMRIFVKTDFSVL